ncbi:unnamed protein product [Litomosoides sigmodontis]|uniref:Uncharacterized protein n=1 Tax=Litomosoides sigmodontis TaxID=42156 RepID=A0A3P6U693_LITSI|nr:unnamed protein product [Litomosoides sigmodontis]
MMSDLGMQEGLARHRGFAVKAREVLLEPPAPFSVVADISGNSSDRSSNLKSPHRGFKAKAREMLVERQTHNSHYSSKPVRSDFNIFHKQRFYANHEASDKSLLQRANIGYDKRETLIPHSKLSRIKAHKLLGEAEKTRSANEIFYDKCMKRVRNPSVRYDLPSASSSHGSLTARYPDTQRSETAKMMNYANDV